MTPSDFFSPVTYWLTSIALALLFWIYQNTYNKFKTAFTKSSISTSIFFGLFFGVFVGIGGREVLINTLTGVAIAKSLDYSMCDQYSNDSDLSNTTVLDGPGFKPAERGIILNRAYVNCLNSEFSKAIDQGIYVATNEYRIRVWKWEIEWR